MKITIKELTGKNKATIAEIIEGFSSFAEGIKAMNTRGHGYIPVRLTKKRARILLDVLNDGREQYHFKYSDNDDNDMQCAVQWVKNFIYKRWSQNELYSD